MAFQPAPGVAEVRMEYSGLNGFMVNIFHVKTTEEWTGEFLENLADLFLTWWRTDLQEFVSSGVTLDMIRVRDLTEEFAGYVELPIVSDNLGGLDSPVMPGNVTAAMKWTTGLTGRSTRGRTYHIGLSEVQCTGGLLTSAARAALITAYDQLRTDVSSAEIAWSLAVLSRVQDGVPLAEAIAYDILAVTTDFPLDSQRRRLVGRGQE